MLKIKKKNIYSIFDIQDYVFNGSSCTDSGFFTVGGCLNEITIKRQSQLK